jgi:hypothetical protein
MKVFLVGLGRQVAVHDAAQPQLDEVAGPIK